MFAHRSWDKQFNVDTERQVLKKHFNGRFILLTEFKPEICSKETAEEIFFYISFKFLNCYTNPGFKSNKSTNYLLDCGDFKR